MAEYSMYEDAGKTYWWNGDDNTDRIEIGPEDLDYANNVMAGRNSGPVRNTIMTATERVMNGINTFLPKSMETDWPVSKEELDAMNQANPKSTIAGDMLPYLPAAAATKFGVLPAMGIAAATGALLADPGDELRDAGLSMIGPVAGKLGSSSLLKKWMNRPKQARVNKKLDSAKNKVTDEFDDVANDTSYQYTQMLEEAKGDPIRTRAILKEFESYKKATNSGQKQATKRATDAVDTTLKYGSGAEDYVIPGLLSPAAPVYDYFERQPR